MGGNNANHLPGGTGNEGKKMNTITIEQVTSTEGVQSISVWEKGSLKRHYVNIGESSTKVWWEADGKLRVEVRKGRDSDEALKTIKRLIGCSLIDRYSKSAEYVIVK